MGNLADYFDAKGYRARWQIGDRVQGHWNRIPFRGTVGNDAQITVTGPPRVSVHLDLPIQFQTQVHTIIFVHPKTLKEFV